MADSSIVRGRGGRGMHMRGRGAPRGAFHSYPDPQMNGGHKQIMFPEGDVWMVSRLIKGRNGNFEKRWIPCSREIIEQILILGKNYGHVSYMTNSFGRKYKITVVKDDASVNGVAYVEQYVSESKLPDGTVKKYEHTEIIKQVKFPLFSISQDIPPFSGGGTTEHDEPHDEMVGGMIDDEEEPRDDEEEPRDDEDEEEEPEIPPVKKESTKKSDK